MTDVILKPRWDIFCKIVDNFGDIGVCWRLARQLHTERGLQVRLWVDDWAVAERFIPPLKNTSMVEGVSFLHWHDAADFGQAADVVIEAFACELPSAYLAAMAERKSKWINLEYLSAETWVDDFHAKPSPQTFLNSANGLTRYFYFPGFTEATGGLLRERDVLSRHYELRRNDGDEKTLSISLFCYPNAPIKALFTALQLNNHKVHVFVPASSILPIVASYFDKDKIEVGDILNKNKLTVEVLPFLSQADYDVLLRDCDINFVRGEDSWIRAVWAGKPFIWQPYLQTDNTHIKKLKAFIDLFYANYEQKDMLWKAHGYWSAEHALQSDFKLIWQNYMNALQSTQFYTKARSQKLAAQADLATKLVNFCNKL